MQASEDQNHHTEDDEEDLIVFLAVQNPKHGVVEGDNDDSAYQPNGDQSIKESAAFIMPGGFQSDLVNSRPKRMTIGGDHDIQGDRLPGGLDHDGFAWNDKIGQAIRLIRIPKTKDLKPIAEDLIDYGVLSMLGIDEESPIIRRIGWGDDEFVLPLLQIL